jgi:hypothetical protein
MNRYKPIGWRNDNYRHSLAARGIRTSLYIKGGGKNKLTVNPGKKEIIEIDMINKPYFEPRFEPSPLPDLMIIERKNIRGHKMILPSAADRRSYMDKVLLNAEVMSDQDGRQLTPKARFQISIDQKPTPQLIRLLRDKGLSVEQRQQIKDTIRVRYDKQEQPFKEEIARRVAQMKAQAEKDVEILENPEAAGYVPIRKGRGRPKAIKKVKEEKKEDKMKEAEEKDEYNDGLFPEALIEELVPDEYFEEKEKKNRSEEKYDKAFEEEDMKSDLPKDGILDEEEEE